MKWPEIPEEILDAILWSLFEVVLVTALSLVPLILIVYYQYVTQATVDAHSHALHQSLIFFVYQNTAAGQLALLAITNWAAVAWTCGLEKGLHIPFRPLFIALCVAGFAYGGVLIAITAAKNYVPSSAVTDPSAWTYAISILCAFLLLVFEKLRPPSAENTNILEVAELHRRVNELRGGQDG